MNQHLSHILKICLYAKTTARKIKTACQSKHHIACEKLKNPKNLMDNPLIGKTILFNLIAGIPGTWLGHFICQRYNSPVVSAKAAILLYMTTTAVASVVLKETTKQYVYLFGMLWGI